MRNFAKCFAILTLLSIIVSENSSEARRHRKKNLKRFRDEFGGDRSSNNWWETANAGRRMRSGGENKRRRNKNKVKASNKEGSKSFRNGVRRKSGDFPRTAALLRRQNNVESGEEMSKVNLLPSDFDKRRKRPNIVLIMSDDQDVELGSLQFMPKLNRYLREEGAYFENGFVTSPICCPSRSSMLTGLYTHNHHVFTNNENCSSTDWVNQHEPRTFATYLQESGYNTGYFGKYLNKYGGNHIPLGWNEWAGLVRNSRFYNYTVNINGAKEKHDFDYAKDYFPDLVTNKSLDFFENSKSSQPDQPVLMVMSYPGPHGPEDSAPQYQHLFFNVTTHHTPAYDYAPNPDKQWILQVTGRMEPIHKKFTDVIMTKRLQTLQSIDEAIEKLHHKLESLGQLENTYIFYTSDHGYHLGQYGLVKGKSFPFELDIKVPFFLRGPNMKAGSVFKEPVLNIDLAPTFLDIAGVEKPQHMDGKSILNIQKQGDNKKWRDSFLIERGKMTHAKYWEIYPHKLNEPTSFPTFNDEFKPHANKILAKKKLTKQERLAVACLKPRYQAPCSAFQTRKCVRKKNGDLKITFCHMMYESDAPDLSQSTPACHCQPGERFGWRMPMPTALALVSSNSEMVDFDSSERKLQSNFLKKHMKKSRKHPKKSQKHRFLKELSGSLRRRRRKNRQRYKREDDLIEEDLEEEEEDQEDVAVVEDKPVEEVLDDLAMDEIVGVDDIMEDISDEIEDLQQSINGSAPSSHRPPDLQCRFLSEVKSVNCSSEIYSNSQDWKNSRTFINEQIRRLRSQLFELKEIRVHLKRSRPFSNKKKSNKSFEDGNGRKVSSYEKVNNRRVNEIPTGAVECKCRQNRRRERNQMRRQRRRMRRKEIRLLRQKRKEYKKMKPRACKKEIEENENKDGRSNCFSHDDQHWRTPPLWHDGKFCACTNSNTNTYWCVRTVNLTHNYLYCEFVDGAITYYDLNIDPYQLRNIYQTLSTNELNYMHQQLGQLKVYSGFDEYENGAKLKKQHEKELEEILKRNGDDQQLQLGEKNKKFLRNKNMSEIRKQKSFIKRYGQYLPPIEAYHSRRREYFFSWKTRGLLVRKKETVSFHRPLHYYY